MLKYSKHSSVSNRCLFTTTSSPSVRRLHLYRLKEAYRYRELLSTFGLEALCPRDPNKESIFCIGQKKCASARKRTSGPQAAKLVYSEHLLPVTIQHHIRSVEAKLITILLVDISQPLLFRSFLFRIPRISHAASASTVIKTSREPYPAPNLQIFV